MRQNIIAANLAYNCLGLFQIRHVVFERGEGGGVGGGHMGTDV